MKAISCTDKITDCGVDEIVIAQLNAQIELMILRLDGGQFITKTKLKQPTTVAIANHPYCLHRRRSLNFNGKLVPKKCCVEISIEFALLPDIFDDIIKWKRGRNRNKCIGQQQRIGSIELCYVNCLINFHCRIDGYRLKRNKIGKNRVNFHEKWNLIAKQ